MFNCFSGKTMIFGPEQITCSFRMEKFIKWYGLPAHFNPNETATNGTMRIKILEVCKIIGGDIMVSGHCIRSLSFKSSPN